MLSILKASLRAVDSHHPAVRAQPATGLRALDIDAGFVTGFAELNKPGPTSCLTCLPTTSAESGI